MPLALAPLLIPAALVGGGIFLARSKKGKKVRKKVRKKVEDDLKKTLKDLGEATQENFAKAAKWLWDEAEKKRDEWEGARWRPLKLQPPLVFRSNLGAQHTGRAKIGNQVVLRVGTKDRLDPVNESKNLLYPLSASDDLGYNYYEVVEVSENIFLKDSFGNPEQGQVFLEKVYKDLPGPSRISFYKYASPQKISGAYGCAQCWYTDSAILEFDGDGNLIGSAQAPTASNDSDRIMQGRYPRPGEMSKVDKLSAFYRKLSGDQTSAIRQIIGESRMESILEIMRNRRPDYELDYVVSEAVDSYNSLPALEQGRLAYQAQSALGRKKISELIDILS